MPESRVVIVTGAARGIGRACARRFADDGCHVVVADVEEEAGAQTAEEISGKNGGALYVKCDVGDRLDVHNLIAETLAAYGRLDVLINNAGIVAPGDILTLDESDFDRVLRVNLKGAFVAAQAAARQMISQIEADEDRRADVLKRYAIVNMSSINGEVAIANQLAYVCSKSALLGLTRAMALTLAPKGVRVNAIGPGSVSTDMLKAVSDSPELQQMLMSRTPLGRIGDADEIASVAAFLAGPDASYITGQCVFVDGGRLALNTVMPAD